MNVQYAIKDGDIYVLEVNPRASRTVPFVAKVIGLPVAKIAARIMAGETLASFKLQKPPEFDHVGVKEAVFPFARFPGVDTVLGPEMKSTGEVMGIDRIFAIAFAKSQLGGGTRAAARGHRVRLGARTPTSRACWRRSGLLVALGFKVIATSGTQRYLAEQGLPAEQDQQGAGRPAAHRRRHQKRRGPAGFQHHRGGHRRWPTAARCGGLPSCIKCHTTPLFPGPSPRRRESKPISGATSRCARCRAISAARPDPGEPGPAA